MKRGYLSEFFDGVAIKQLAGVEVDTSKSNQHEFNATRKMLDFMGRPAQSQRFDARFIYLNDEGDNPVVEDAFLTLYDSRANQPNRSPEYRFYFPSTLATELAEAGDMLLVAKRRDGGILAIIADHGSSAESQIKWLFGFSDEAYPEFSVRSELETEQDRIGFAATLVLESIGVVVEPATDNYLDEMLGLFGGTFPSSAVFSEFARRTLGEVDPREDPDAVLIAWMEREEVLFRTLERHLVANRLKEGFSGADVDDFVSFSLSVHNRRKSRVGHALENHLATIFEQMGIKFERHATTENRAKPDFLFPGRAEYEDSSFDDRRLLMLAAKSTCKDRWRQVLAEADRIDRKHLLTLESAISAHQTDEMQSKGVQLVVPVPLHETYTEKQRGWLWKVCDFTNFVLELQGG